MLQYLRNRMKTILWITVFAFIGTIFLSWGMGGVARRSVNRVAVVNGESITPQEYYNMLQRLQKNVRELLGDNYTEEIAKQFNLENQAIEGLVMQKLMLQKAKEMDLIVTDAEVIAKIKTYPQFQTAGQFDPVKYNSMLNNPRNAKVLPSIELGERRQLLMDKLDLLIKGSVMVTEKEIRDQFHRDNDRYKIAFLRLNPIDYVTREKVNQYYKEHAEEFRNPEMIKASHILFKVEGSEEETLKEAQRVRGEILAGTDFAKMAVEHSDGPTAANGGDLGFFSRGQMVPQFDEVAFGLKVEEVSEPVKTEFGYHLIKVTEKQGGEQTLLDDAYDRVAQKVLASEESTLADELLNKVKDKIAQVGTIEEAAKAYNLLVTESNEFKWQEKIADDLLWNEQLWLAAASLEVNQVSQILAFDQKKYLLQLKQRLVGEEKEYQKQRQSIKDEIFKSKRDNLFQTWYEDLRANSKVEILLKDYEDAVRAFSG